jgi:succinoglycan biosynthesis protein ExoV
MFVNGDFDAVEPETYFMGVGSILHPAYLERFSGEQADSFTYGGMASRMKKGVIFGSGVREAKLNFDPSTLDFRFVRGPISSQQTGAKHITDAAYLLPLLKEHSDITALPKKHKISLMPYFHHISALDYDKISEETGVNIIPPYEDVHKILCEVQQSELLVSGAMHGCIAADIFRVPWIRLRFKTHENNPIVQSVKWHDFSGSMELNALSTLRMSCENTPNSFENTELERELIYKLNFIYKITPTLSSDRVYTDRIEKLAEAVRAFSREYGIPINSFRTIIGKS